MIPAAAFRLHSPGVELSLPGARLEILLLKLGQGGYPFYDFSPCPLPPTALAPFSFLNPPPPHTHLLLFLELLCVCACKRESQQEETTCKGEFGAACPRASSSPAHLTISPGKLSVGEGGDGRLEHSQSAGSVGEGSGIGKGLALIAAGIHRKRRRSGSPPQKGTGYPRPPKVTTDAVAQESSTSFQRIWNPASKTESCSVE